MLEPLIKVIVVVTSGVASICIILLHMTFWFVIAGLVLRFLL